MKLQTLLNLFSISLVLSFSQSISASSFWECNVHAIVADVAVTDSTPDSDILLKINIFEVEPVNTQHAESCLALPLGEKKILAVAGPEVVLSKIAVQNTLLIKFTSYTAMGENGVVQDETWKVLDIR